MNVLKESTIEKIKDFFYDHRCTLHEIYYPPHTHHKRAKYTCNICGYYYDNCIDTLEGYSNTKNSKRRYTICRTSSCYNNTSRFSRLDIENISDRVMRANLKLLPPFKKEYKDKDKIKVECISCGLIFFKKVTNLPYSKCKGCASTGYKTYLTGELYYIRIHDFAEPIYKIGVTNLDVYSRNRGHFKKYDVLFRVRGNGTDILFLEDLIKRVYQDKRYYTDKRFVGHTECFNEPLELPLELKKILKEGNNDIVYLK